MADSKRPMSARPAEDVPPGELDWSVEDLEFDNEGRLTIEVGKLARANAALLIRPGVDHEGTGGVEVHILRADAGRAPLTWIPLKACGVPTTFSSCPTTNYKNCRPQKEVR